MNRNDQKIVGHWCLFATAEGWRLTEWMRRGEAWEQWNGTDLQAASDFLLGRMEATLRRFLLAYKACVFEYEKATAENRPLKPGFRVSYNATLRAKAVNTYNTISVKFREETSRWLEQLPAYGWLPVSRVPFADLADVPDRL